MKASVFWDWLDFGVVLKVPTKSSVLDKLGAKVELI
jgi:hypothetical protein